MPRNPNISQEDFDEILAWLDSDREQAGVKYEDLRQSLVRILGWKGCVDAEGLADETIDRVTRRIHDLRRTYKGDPRLYFYAVANNVAREYKKKTNLYVPIGDVETTVSTPPPANEEKDRESDWDCFDTCLRELSLENRELILEYYLKEKQAKIDHRKEIAQRLGVSVKALRVRMYRIRAALEECIGRCLDELADDE